MGIVSRKMTMISEMDDNNQRKWMAACARTRKWESDKEEQEDDDN